MEASSLVAGGLASFKQKDILNLGDFVQEHDMLSADNQLLKPKAAHNFYRCEV